MTSGNDDRNTPVPPKGKDRKVLFGLGKDGGRPPPAPGSTAAPGPSPDTEDPPDLAAAVAALATGQQQLGAKLEELTAALVPEGGDETDLVALSKKISETAEWANNLKAATNSLLESTGKQIEGLKSGQKNHDAALARLKILEEGLDKVVPALDATVKGLDKRSSELGTVKQDLTKYYSDWTAEAKSSRGEMKALSKRLDAGDHMVTRLEKSIGPWTEQMEESIGANSTAQRAAAAKTADNVEKLATTGTTFLNDFATARGAALKEARQEWTRIRRWTVPALALALVLAVPVFVVAGALGQSEFVVFEPYDETGGWMEAVWENHGKQVRLCMHNSFKMQQVIPCSFDVDFR